MSDSDSCGSFVHFYGFKIHKMSLEYSEQLFLVLKCMTDRETHSRETSRQTDRNR